jgi:hypothetical protein
MISGRRSERPTHGTESSSPWVDAHRHANVQAKSAPARRVGTASRTRTETRATTFAGFDRLHRLVEGRATCRALKRFHRDPDPRSGEAMLPRPRASLGLHRVGGPWPARAAAARRSMPIHPSDRGTSDREVPRRLRSRFDSRRGENLAQPARLRVAARPGHELEIHPRSDDVAEPSIVLAEARSISRRSVLRGG